MDLLTELIAALTARTPVTLAETAAEILARHGYAEARLWLPDYQRRWLVPADLPVETHGMGVAVPVSDSEPGRVFASQRAACDGDHVRVPLSVRGERRGVLEVRLPVGGRVDVPQELLDVAPVLAATLILTDRITDRYLLAPRTQRLSVAAELQWSMLPGLAYAEDDFAAAGLLEPAYSVAGDVFDWVRTPTHFQVAVLDGRGGGVPASLVTALAIAALRNARRVGAGLVDQASLVDQALFAQYRGAQYVSTLMLSLDLTTGVVELVDAGSPALYRMRGRDVERIPLEEQLPLGMFEETLFRSQYLPLMEGDRLVIASDGVLHAPSSGGDTFTRRGLEAALRELSLLPASEAVRHVMRSLTAHRGGTDLADDAVVVCLDWKRPGG